MNNSRRFARELALKALFQKDVGQQPLDEIIGGLIGQIKIPAEDPVRQIVSLTLVEIGSVCKEIEPKHAPMETRRIRRFAKDASSLLSDYAAEVSDTLGTFLLQNSRVEVELPIWSNFANRTKSSLRLNALKSGIHSARFSLMNNNAEQMLDRCSLALDKHLPAAIFITKFMETLIMGTLDKQAEIDKRVSALSEGWTMDRQPAVDRNILRLAAYELIYVPGIPVGATINEAVELAKKYSTAESGKFINGVLGVLAKGVEKTDPLPDEEFDLGPIDIVEEAE